MPTLMSAITQPSSNGTTAQATSAVMKVIIGAMMNSDAVGARRDDGLLQHQLEAVGEGLQQAERADHVGAAAELDRGPDLAVDVGHVGDGHEQRHGDGEALEQDQDRLAQPVRREEGDDGRDHAPTPPPSAC